MLKINAQNIKYEYKRLTWTPTQKKNTWHVMWNIQLEIYNRYNLYSFIYFSFFMLNIFFFFSYWSYYYYKCFIFIIVVVLFVAIPSFSHCSKFEWLIVLHSPVTLQCFCLIIITQVPFYFQKKKKKYERVYPILKFFFIPTYNIFYRFLGIRREWGVR